MARNAADRGTWAGLAELNSLRTLLAIDTDLADGGLDVLLDLPKLEKVTLRLTPKVTAAGVDRFRGACPKVVVEFRLAR